ncbi:MAG: NAD+ synthase [Alphaproteobacteria bacterium]|nr:MAG: NAD+ synthase [Alphaproteobacteria bacterium]
MSDRFRLTVAQLNPVLGDLAGNAEMARAARRAGAEAGADLVVLPEMFLTGYQLQDLVIKPAFLADVWAHLDALAGEDGPPMGIGAPWRLGAALHNAYHILSPGAEPVRILKHFLPHKDVFDEYRLYTPGEISGPVRIGPARIGFPICEDAWYPDVTETLAETGAEILVVPNGSPYYRDKQELRQSLMVSRVVETGLPLVYFNLVGGQDDQVFDGASFALNPHGVLAAQFPPFAECIRHLDFERGAEGWACIGAEMDPVPDGWEQDYNAMVLAVRDYWRKTGFSRALLGLSGGVDSALVATIAADALGPQNVRCVMLPSRHTAATSLEDARAVAAALGCRLDTVPISEARAAVEATLAPLFAGLAPDVTEENIQSRLRAVFLMALSNKFGEMLLTTGNKSEMAVGYATIYGDMAGAYNPIKDLYKTRVFQTCRWRNANHRGWMKGPAGPVIPERVITKPPSAELREDQRDEDSLPPYEILDAILEGLVENDRSVEDLVAAGFARETVKKVENLLYISEYKRFQSAPGTRLTRKAFWLDRRYPIVNRWRDGS